MNLTKTTLIPLVKISQRFPVLIESGICLQIIAKRLRHKQRIDGICLQWADQILSSKDYFTPEETQRFIEYILRNPIGIAYWLPEQEQLYWDLAFAKSNSAFPANVESHVDRLQLLVGSNAKDCVRLANEFHWSFWYPFQKTKSSKTANRIVYSVCGATLHARTPSRSNEISVS